MLVHHITTLETKKVYHTLSYHELHHNKHFESLLDLTCLKNELQVEKVMCKERNNKKCYYKRVYAYSYSYCSKK